MSAYRTQEEKERREDERRRPWSRRAHLVARFVGAAWCLGLIGALEELPVARGFRFALQAPIGMVGALCVIFGIAIVGCAPATGKELVRYWSSPIDDEGSAS